MDWQKVIDELRSRADDMKQIADNPYKHSQEKMVAAIGVIALGGLAESLRAGLDAPPKKEPCDHAGWSFAAHGRGCVKCGKIIADAGD